MARGVFSVQFSDEIYKIIYISLLIKRKKGGREGASTMLEQDRVTTALRSWPLYFPDRRIKDEVIPLTIHVMFMEIV